MFWVKNSGSQIEFFFLAPGGGTRILAARQLGEAKAPRIRVYEA